MHDLDWVYVRDDVTNSLRDLLVGELMKVSLLLQRAADGSALRLHPALRHQTQLRVHIYGLHLSVIVIICGEAGDAMPKQTESNQTHIRRQCWVF